LVPTLHVNNIFGVMALMSICQVQWRMCD